MDNLRLHGIAVYNPGLWSREELKAYFVARQELLEQILAALRQQKADVPCQHRLLLGLRGMGKSTLLRRIALAVEEDAELNQHWLPLTFPEEQYNISTAADLWRNCLDAFCDLIEEREGKAQAEALDEALHGLADDEVFSRLLAEADARNRRLLLLIDNIDLILERLKKEEPELRRVLQKEPRLFLIGASAQQEVKADFFSATDKLAGLSLAEMQAMLTRLVEQELAQKKTPSPPAAEHPVLVLLRDDPARIKTLHTLTGGNPRTVALLYNVLARGLDGDVRSDLEGLLDLVTPLYKARFEELPQQAQQLVDGLAVNWDPMTARQLADTLKWDINITSSQLNRLQQQGHVEKVEPAKGGRAAFQIGERFFNIWYLMRASRRVRRKLIWLVHFLRMFFSAAELHGHAKKLLLEEELDIRRAEYKLALARTVENKSLQRSLEYNALRCLLRQEKDSRKIEAMFDLQGEDSELRPLLNYLKIETLIDQAVQAGIMTAKDDVDGAEKAAELYNKPEIAAEAWSNWLLFNFLEKKALSEQKAKAAENAFRKAIDANSADVEIWLFLAMLLDRSKRFDEAEQAYRKAVEVEPDSAVYWSSFARFLEKRGRLDETEAAYRKAIEINPDNSLDRYQLGIILYKLKRINEIDNAFKDNIKREDVYSDLCNSFALFLYDHQDRINDAIIFAKKSVKLKNMYAVNTLAILLVANNQWPEAEPHIYTLLNKGDDDFFELILEDILTLFKEAYRTGKAAEALALLDESPLAERWRPLREALAAAVEGTSRYLNGVAPEVRDPALAILKDIAPDVLPSS